MKIWVYLNNMQQGPYTFEQVKLLPLEPGTPVWYEGLSKWLPASEAPLTAPLFATAPSAAPSWTQPSPAYAPGQPQYAAEPVGPRPSSHLVWCILLTVLCCSPFGIAGLFTGSAATRRYDNGDYEGSRRMAEATDWLVILGIVWGIIGPMVLLAML